MADSPWLKHKHCEAKIWGLTSKLDPYLGTYLRVKVDGKNWEKHVEHLNYCAEKMVSKSLPSRNSQKLRIYHDKSLINHDKS